MTDPIDRRRALGLLGALGLGAVVTACGSSTKSSSASTAASQAVDCVLTPEVTEGPFYLDLNSLRSDITDGKAGTPLAVRITVVDATACTPIKDAAVDIWHCDAEGVYSGFAQEGTGGQTYLRGTQVTSAAGVAEFQTIYPGWYQGRAVHVHMKVHVGGSEVHTGQFFFDPAVSKAVYQSGPYNSSADTSNSGDGIYRQAGGEASVLRTTQSSNGYAGAIVVGVNA